MQEIAVQPGPGFLLVSMQHLNPATGTSRMASSIGHSGSDTRLAPPSRCQLLPCFSICIGSPARPALNAKAWAQILSQPHSQSTPFTGQVWLFSTSLALYPPLLPALFRPRLQSCFLHGGHALSYRKIAPGYEKGSGRERRKKHRSDIHH